MATQSSRVLEFFASEKTRSARFVLGFGVLLALSLYCLRPLYSFGDYAEVIRFADERSWLGLQNFADVVSNLGFLYVGAWGVIWSLAARGQERTGRAVEQVGRGLDLSLASVLFASLFFTGLGSAYFHLNPTGESLLWDRLPMVVGFAALIGLLVGDRVDRRWARNSFSLLTAVGLFTLIDWKMSGSALTYSIFQAGAIVSALLLPLLFSRGRLSNRSIYLAIGGYALAKLFEFGDAAIFQATHLIAGHALKHVAAAVAMLFILQGLRCAIDPKERALKSF